MIRKWCGKKKGFEGDDGFVERNKSFAPSEADACKMTWEMDFNGTTLLLTASPSSI